MARLKVTNLNIIQRMTEWVNGQNRDNEYIFFANEIDEADIKQKAWNLGHMIIHFVPDNGPESNPLASGGFRKIIFVEKLPAPL
jgi:hypothetical protein